MYNSAIKIITIVLPILLFIFKYILPMLAKKIFGENQRLDFQDIIVELIHFPVDLEFIAITFAFPNIIEILERMQFNSTDNGIDTTFFEECIHNLIINGLFVFVLVVLLPFSVFFIRYNDSQYFKGNKICAMILTIIAYMISILFIVISLNL